MRGSEAYEFRKNASQTLRPFFQKKGRINFISYFNLMSNAKSALVPPGNALWSYRHYEAIYAGAIPVTSNFREAEMLVPLPVEGMIHVGNGESVIPHVDSALRILKDNPRLPARNLEFVERYMSNGLFDRKKSLLIERFMKQIEKN